MPPINPAEAMLLHNRFGDFSRFLAIAGGVSAFVTGMMMLNLVLNHLAINSHFYVALSVEGTSLILGGAWLSMHEKAQKVRALSLARFFEKYAHGGGLLIPPQQQPVITGNQVVDTAHSSMGSTLGGEAQKSSNPVLGQVVFGKRLRPCRFSDQ